MPTRGTLPLRVHVELHPPLLYWADRRQWMWHKKWALPTVTVRVERTDTPSDTGGGANGGVTHYQPDPHVPNNRFIVFVTAGTLQDDDDDSVLENHGLGGDCQRLLQLGPHGAAEASFTRLLFQVRVPNIPIRTNVGTNVGTVFEMLTEQS